MRFTLVHGAKTYTIKSSESFNTEVAFVRSAPRINHSTVKPRIVMTRAREPLRTGRTESTMVSTDSMPLYALMPIVATRAETETTRRIVPAWVTVLLPAREIPVKASDTPRRVAIHAPTGISQIGDPAAPMKTAATMPPRDEFLAK